MVGGRCFIWSVVCGRSSIWSVVGSEFLVWSVVGGFYGRCGWSVSNVVGGRCFAFLLVGGRFLFLIVRFFLVGRLWEFY